MNSSAGWSGLSTWPIVPAADAGWAGLLSSPIFPLLLIVPIFYLLVLRPQQEQRRKTREMLANLKTGDRVLTTGGIYGTIAGFRGNIIQLQVANQVKVEVARTAISGLDTGEGESQAEGSARKEAGGKEKEK